MDMAFEGTPEEAANFLHLYSETQETFATWHVNEHLAIVRLTSANGLYACLRPFMEQLAIQHALDAPLEDSPGKIWWMAFTKTLSGQIVAGWCGARPSDPDVPAQHSDTFFESFFVRAPFRRMGIGRALFHQRLLDYSDLRVRAWCSTESKPLYDLHGFRTVKVGVSARGHAWWEMRLNS